MNRFSTFALSLLAACTLAHAAPAAGPTPPANWTTVFEKVKGKQPEAVATYYLLALRSKCEKQPDVVRNIHSKVDAAFLALSDPDSDDAPTEGDVQMLAAASAGAVKEMQALVDCNVTRENLYWLNSEVDRIGEDRLLRADNAIRDVRRKQDKQAQLEKDKVELQSRPKKGISDDPKAWYRHYFPDYAYLTTRRIGYASVQTVGQSRNKPLPNLFSEFAAYQCAGAERSSQRVEREQLASPADAYAEVWGYGCTPTPQELAAVPGRSAKKVNGTRGAAFDGELDIHSTFSVALKFGTLDTPDAYRLVSEALEAGSRAVAPRCSNQRPFIGSMEFWLRSFDDQHDGSLKVRYLCGAAPVYGVER